MPLWGGRRQSCGDAVGVVGLRLEFVVFEALFELVPRCNPLDALRVDPFVLVGPPNPVLLLDLLLRQVVVFVVFEVLSELTPRC